MQSTSILLKLLALETFVESGLSFQLPSPFVMKNNRQTTDVNIVHNIALNMALVPLPVDELEDYLVIGPPSGSQYATYWGRTKRERYNRFLEASIVTFLGVFFSYFLSFVLGGFVATLFGATFAFWGVLSPELKARQRNWEFLGGRALVDPWIVRGRDEEKQGLYGSLFIGKVDDVCVVYSTSSLEEYELDDFQDYTMESDELEQFSGTPYLIRVKMSDGEGRELQTHARMSEDYLDIQTGMPVLSILLSTSQKFTSLAALTDFMIPDAEAWVGDYPYLNRPEIEARLAEDDELWDLLQAQGSDISDSEDDTDKDDFIGEEDAADRDFVPVRRRRS
ncbi:unnamed protein product [Cylindrotheca closterium]|uniref:Uncharacterized protein n=1 Tax=Cylindrotheca closterium TaxID=2856 RepID=A0AAD2GAT3_9STRA|nr:unnamed protein product [Cylindrotheca closterium]